MSNTNGFEGGNGNMPKMKADPRLAEAARMKADQEARKKAERDGEPTFEPIQNDAAYIERFSELVRENIIGQVHDAATLKKILASITPKELKAEIQKLPFRTIDSPKQMGKSEVESLLRTDVAMIAAKLIEKYREG